MPRWCYLRAEGRTCRQGALPAPRHDRAAAGRTRSVDPARGWALPPATVQPERSPSWNAGSPGASVVALGRLHRLLGAGA